MNRLMKAWILGTMLGGASSLVGSAWAVQGSGAAVQASLVLKGSSVTYCNKHENSWTITKVPDKAKASVGEDVTWTITATKNAGPSVPSTICADGYVEITNSGAGDATIGNIVVNLQGLKNLKKSGTSWVSLAADMADATNGEDAAFAKIVASQSSELLIGNTNTNDKGNYSVSGSVGTFVTTAGSGTVVFTSAGGDEVFHIQPQMTIPGGKTTKFYFSATYNLVVAAGTPLRAEVIVTFGNAGARGGGGASYSGGVDINGNLSATDSGEDNIRSVPTRITMNAPAVQECNDTVTLTDTFTNEAGDDSSITPAPVGSSPAWGTISTGGSWTYTYTVQGPPSSSSAVVSMTNVVDLDGTKTYVNLQTGVDPTGAPIVVPFLCCDKADLSDVSTVTVKTCEEDSSQPTCGGTTTDCETRYGTHICYCLDNPDDTLTCGHKTGDFCSYTQGGYRAGNGNGEPQNLIQNNWLTVFTGGMRIGVQDGLADTLHDAEWTATSDGLDALRDALTDTGTPGALLVDSSDSGALSGHNLSTQTATLTLNIGFSGTTGLVKVSPDQYKTIPAGFGGLYYFDPLSSMNGMTVSQILAAANTALAGGAIPAGYDYGSLTGLIDNLNKSFDNCVPTDFANAHLF